MLSKQFQHSIHCLYKRFQILSQTDQEMNVSLAQVIYECLHVYVYVSEKVHLHKQKSFMLVKLFALTEAQKHSTLYSK